MPFSSEEKRKEYKRKYYAANREHSLAKSRAWYFANKEYAKAYRLEWQRKNKDRLNAKQRERWLVKGDKLREQARARYKLKAHVLAYRQKTAAHKAYLTGKAFGKRPAAPYPPTKVCECCGKKPRKKLAYDHCHKTGKFRGWVCNTCNVGIGMLGDCVGGIKKAMRYLSRNIK